MHVQLDEELWEMADSARLEEVLTRISDAAQAKGCVVKTLVVGDRPFTDRDLMPAVLSQQASGFGKIVATSQSIQDLLNSGASSAGEFGVSLKSEGEPLVRLLRRGEMPFKQIDGWLGQMADYIEWTELARSLQAPSAPGESLSPWVEEILQAREQEDTVRLADLLEYEVIPRLANSHS